MDTRADALLDRAYIRPFHFADMTVGGDDVHIDGAYRCHAGLQIVATMNVTNNETTTLV
jgi:hypothetical protein